MFEWIKGVLESGGYFGLLFLTFLENVFPPIPSELIMPFAGALVREEKMAFFGAWLAGTLGSTLGSLPLYYVGHQFGADRVRYWCENHGYWIGVDGEDFDKARAWFNKHQGRSVFLCRLVPGMRSLIAVPAGINRMDMKRFLVYTLAGTGLWTLLLVGLGFWLGPQFKKIDEFLGPFSKVIIGSIVLYFVYRGITKYKEKKATRAAREKP